MSERARAEQSESPGIPVIGGPFSGAVIPPREAAPRSLLLEGEGGDIPEGHAARYRYSPKVKGYVFKGIEQIVYRTEL